MTSLSCDDIESVSQYLDHHAEDDRVLDELTMRIHGLTGQQFAESGMLPMRVVADLVLGVHQTKACEQWNLIHAPEVVAELHQAAVSTAPPIAWVERSRDAGHTVDSYVSPDEHYHINPHGDDEIGCTVRAGGTRIGHTVTLEGAKALAERHAQEAAR